MQPEFSSSFLSTFRCWNQANTATLTQSCQNPNLENIFQRDFPTVNVVLPEAIAGLMCLVNRLRTGIGCVVGAKSSGG